MIALIAGEGALPGEICARLAARGTPPLVCVMEGVAPDVPEALPRTTFRLETLGTFLQELRDRGVEALCMAGAMRRPPVDPARMDAATAPLAARIEEGLRQGDDGTLRTFIAIFEEHGIEVLAVHEIVPDLLPPAGVLAGAAPDHRRRAEARLGEATVAEMGAADTGQACVISGDRVIAREGPEGTDAMLAGVEAPGAMLFKAPKPDQDRRADLPVVGPETARGAARAGLGAICIEAGGVMVLGRDETTRLCAEAGITLWVRG
ncbi:LpxI family protein [Histidinibacterium aquaticum]|uniref:LpxI family protein n=1 Tax=Histidinibacterium aquaticum TaxID=2613962 RepID=A0A5J5GMJ1_9RHOB|nr:UDP-2,3-diacylglucosamine diphosphatase LpxI [Histidinibacterium aquaticum]KAA9008903.1 LpxI family protein [Histidinibacterium aquaticum]